MLRKKIWFGLFCTIPFTQGMASSSPDAMYQQSKEKYEHEQRLKNAEQEKLSDKQHYKNLLSEIHKKLKGFSQAENSILDIKEFLVDMHSYNKPQISSLRSKCGEYEGAMSSLIALYREKIESLQANIDSVSQDEKVQKNAWAKDQEILNQEIKNTNSILHAIRDVCLFREDVLTKPSSNAEKNYQMKIENLKNAVQLSSQGQKNITEIMMGN